MLLCNARLPRYMALPTTTNMPAADRQRWAHYSTAIAKRTNKNNGFKRTHLCTFAHHRPSCTNYTANNNGDGSQHHRYMADNNKYSGNGSILLDGVIRLQITDRTNDKRLQNTHLRHRTTVNCRCETVT